MKSLFVIFLLTLAQAQPAGHLAAGSLYPTDHPTKGDRSDVQMMDAVQGSLIATQHAVDFNIRLKHLADSTMKSIFGEIGFAKNFTLTCLQNPCEKGYRYANTFVSNRPCSSAPQDSCQEAILTYRYVKPDVPLEVKLLVTVTENGSYVNIENTPFGRNKVALDKQNLLSVAEIQAIITERFPKDSLEILPYGRALVYAHTRIERNESKNEDPKLNRDPGYRVIKETNAGAFWQSGFRYTARSKDPKKGNRVYHLDAVTGELLWITEVYSVAE